MSELWEKELEHEEYECCEECGCEIQNGETYYDIDGIKLCESCVNDKFKRIMDYDDYTYQDYLCEKYEGERHDA